MLDHFGLELFLPHAALSAIGPLVRGDQLLLKIGKLLAHRPHEGFRHLADSSQQLIRPPVFSPVDRLVSACIRPLVVISATVSRRRSIYRSLPIVISRRPLVAIPSTVGRKAVGWNQHPCLATDGLGDRRSHR